MPAVYKSSFQTRSPFSRGQVRLPYCENERQSLFDVLRAELQPPLGRGKTSLVRLLAGELKAHGGQLAINGIRLDQQAGQYKQQVYYVDPRTEAFDQMTVPEYFASVRARFPGFDDAVLPALLEGLSLTPHVEKKLFMLSTGSKRKVYLAGAFAAGAEVNLLDDPFAGLDQRSINFVCETLNASGKNREQMWAGSFHETPEGLSFVANVDLGD